MQLRLPDLHFCLLSLQLQLLELIVIVRREVLGMSHSVVDSRLHLLGHVVVGVDLRHRVVESS